MVVKLGHLYLMTFILFNYLALLHGVSSADQAILDNGGLLSYVYVGGKHMITGYDHLLFLAGVVFYLSSVKDIIKFISVFTIGHSLTLIGATYLNIKADEHLIDAVIAFSVLYKGFENLGGFQRLKIKPPNLLIMVFLFGLIHGLGLSTRLQSFKMSTNEFFASIVSFNIGVEIGQIFALVPIVLLLTQWKKYTSYEAFYKAANLYLIIAGITLLIYQIHGYLTTM